MTILSPVLDTAPRYTSYPTAPHFHAGIDAATVDGWIGALAPDEPLSLYLHVPFCDKLCWFCACHTRHTLRYEPVADFLKVALEEIALVSSRLGGRGVVKAIHFGGGSPTMLVPEDLARLVDAMRAAFRIHDRLAFSVEIDPADMDPGRLDALAAVGVNRASLGVQDFDPRVQRAINRMQSFELTRDVVQALRGRGIGAINLDLVYGLPHQTTEGFAQTVSRCLELEPDRLAIFGYAHVPWFKKHQTMIDAAALPGASARREQAAVAAELAVAAGYEAIGIDHFALPGDTLSAAMRQGTLRRNFQGYTDDDCLTLIGLGPSSVSRYSQGFAQNKPAMGDYARAVRARTLPVARGIALSDEDRVRGWAIERLMCEFGFDAEALAAQHAPVAAQVLAEAAALAQDGLLTRRGGRFDIAGDARLLARSVAARLDPYFAAGTARHSAAV